MTARRFTCECADADCREQFVMDAGEYRRAVLADCRVVVRGHTKAKDRVLAAVGDALIVKEGKGKR